MPIIADPRYQPSIVGPTFAAPAPAEPAGPAPKAPSALDIAAAAARGTLPGALQARLSEADPEDDDPPPPGFDPLDDIAGFEDYATSFMYARTPGEVKGVKARIRRELADKETLARAGWSGTAADITAGILDPSFLVSLAVPEIALARGGRAGKFVQSAVEGLASSSAYEVGMQSLQETRSAQQTLTMIGAGTVLSGTLGSLLGRVAPADRKAAQEAVEAALAEPAPMTAPRSEVGAASASSRTTLEQERLAAGAEVLSKLSDIPLIRTDAQVILGSESLAARQALQDLAEITPVMVKNEADIASPTSVESLVARHEGRVATFVTDLKSAYKEYRARPLPEGEARLTRQQFESAVAFAARRGDADVVPEVARAASSLRGKVFDPLKQAAQRLGLLPADSEIELFAQSYFRRMYDRDAIIARRGEWNELLVNHFSRRGLELLEAKAAAEDITRRILGTDRGLANFNIRSVGDAGPLKDRVLDIQDELIEPFLVNDPIKVAASYVRELAPQIEVTRRFGEKDMVGTMQAIRDEFDVLRAQAGLDAKKIDALTKNEVRTLEALTRLRDRLYGTAGAVTGASLGERKAADVLRGWRNLVTAARMGGTALTGGAQDLARIVAQYGFAKTMGRLAKLATSSEFRQISKTNARRLGVATEVAMARRLQVEESFITEGWTQKLADTTYRVTGLNHLTDFYRTLSATLLEDKILRAAADVAAGKALKRGPASELAALGLDSARLARIAKEVETHGTVSDGIRLSGSAKWRDQALADAYDGAIIKETRQTVIQPGIADRVWWMDGEIGKTLGQLKAFTMSAPLKLVARPVQLVGQGRHLEAARFVGMMMVGGYLAHAFRNLAAGREPVTDPQAVAGEAFVESGLGGIMPDALGPVARYTGLFGESSKYSDRNPVGAYGGPALGAAFDAWDVLYNRTRNGMSANDLHKLRALLPMQNVWWLRRAINAVEGETAEALDLQGATPSSFGERLVATDPMVPTAQRDSSPTPLQ